MEGNGTENIGCWILEFLLRQPVDDAVVKLALSSLPLPPDCSLPLGLKKSIVLRTVQSALSDGSISENLLDHLETLEAIDAKLGDPVPGSLKDAYRAVAVECTLRCLHGGAGGQASYSDVVQRIWRGRVQAMEAKSQLITAELLQWNAPLEAALSDETEREMLMMMTDATAEALRSVRAYLDEAFSKLGPPFLQSAALSTATGRVASEPTPDCEPPAVAAGDAAATLDVAAYADFADASANDAAIAPGGNREAPEVRDSAKSKNVVPSKSKEVLLHRHRGIKITDVVESGGQTSCSSYDSLPTPLVDKVHEALKSSSLELQLAVEDPLPEAMRLAASLVPDDAHRAPHPESMPPDQIRKDVGATDLSSDETATDAAPSTMGYHEAQQCGPLNVLPRRSLMERKRSAQTYQWEDSPAGTSDQKDRPQLHTPKGLVVSPLKKVEPENVRKRRRRKRWSLEEEDTLRTGVEKYGQGNWKLILNNYRDIFEERTEVDLKDKWRNMMH